VRFFVAMFAVELVVKSDAPGLSSSNLARFSFKNVRRPIFPLDDF